MITGIARMKSQLAFAGLAFTLLVSAGTPMLSGPAAMAKGGKHHGRGQHGQVHRDKDRGPEQHCVGELVAGSDAVQHEACYRTFEQAQAAAGERGHGASSERYNESIVGILYDAINYDTSGGTYTFRMTNSAVGCSNGYSVAMQTMPAGWDNRVSSAKVFSGCKATYYIDSYLSGAAKTGAAINGYDIPNMESFDYRISSIKWSKA
jgi:hypothetical protein